VNASIKTSDQIILNPQGYLSMQAGANELVIGGNLQYTWGGNGDQQLIAGIYYRAKDAFIPMVGFEMKNIRITFTYDATTSSLQQYNNSRGAYEFALMDQGFYSQFNGDRRQSMCPSFKQ